MTDPRAEIVESPTKVVITENNGEVCINAPLPLLGSPNLPAAIAILRSSQVFPLGLFPQAGATVEDVRQWMSTHISTKDRLQALGVIDTVLRGKGKTVSAVQARGIEAAVLGSNPVLATEVTLNGYDLYPTSRLKYTQENIPNAASALESGDNRSEAEEIARDELAQQVVNNRRLRSPDLARRILEKDGLLPGNQEMLYAHRNELIYGSNPRPKSFTSVNRGDVPLNAADMTGIYLDAMNRVNLIGTEREQLLAQINGATLKEKEIRDGIKKKKKYYLQVFDGREAHKSYVDEFMGENQETYENFINLLRGRHQLLISRGYTPEEFLKLMAPGRLTVDLGEGDEVSLSGLVDSRLEEMKGELQEMFSTEVDADEIIKSAFNLIDKGKGRRPTVNYVDDLPHYFEEQEIELTAGNSDRVARREFFIRLNEYNAALGYRRFFDKVDEMANELQIAEQEGISVHMIPNELVGISAGAYSYGNGQNIPIEATEDVRILKEKAMSSEQLASIGAFLKQRKVKNESGQPTGETLYSVTADGIDNLGTLIAERTITIADANIILYSLLRSLNVVEPGTIVDINDRTSTLGILNNIIALKNVGFDFTNQKSVPKGLRKNVGYILDLLDRIEPIFASNVIEDGTEIVEMSEDKQATDMDPDNN